MSDPQRWLTQAGQLSALERRLLESAERIAPPTGSKQQVWSALAANLPLSPLPVSKPPPVGSSAPAAPSAGSGAAGAGTAGQATLTISMLKAMAVGFALGTASVGTAAWLVPSDHAATSRPAPTAIGERAAPAPAPHVLERAAPTEHVTTPALSASAARPRPAARAEAEAPPIQDSAPALKHVDPSAARAAFPDVPPVAAPAQAATAPPGNESDRARMESRRVAEARSQLRAGNARGALSLLQAIAVEFPSGVLVQEREALTIESLLSCGEQAAARTRALDFLRRYPGSPHALSVQRALP